MFVSEQWPCNTERLLTLVFAASFFDHVKLKFGKKRLYTIRFTSFNSQHFLGEIFVLSNQGARRSDVLESFLPAQVLKEDLMSFSLFSSSN